MDMPIASGLPLAQRLPIEIVRRFVQEAAFGVPKIKKALPSCKRNHEPTCIWGLLSVCRLWRAAALPVYSSTVAVFAKDDRRLLCCARNGLSATKACALGWQHHVLGVLVVATSQSLVQGATFETISGFGGMFEKASHAKLHLFGGVQPAHAAHGQNRFDIVDTVPLFGIIGESFCALRRVQIEASNVCFGISSGAMEPHGTALSDRAASIYRSIVCMDLSSCQELVLLDVPMPALTTLSLDVFCSSIAHCFELVRQQAGNLEHLQISHLKASDCPEILLDAHGRQTVYPRLKRLKLDVLGAFSDDNSIERSRGLFMRLDFAGKKSWFPVIEHINCRSFYPFTDNILWKGAESTLKSLVISADDILTGWLFPENTNKAAFPGPLAKCSQLQYLEVQIITRADALDTRTQIIHSRVISVVAEILHIKRVCLCYPNSYTVEFKK